MTFLFIAYALGLIVAMSVISTATNTLWGRGKIWFHEMCDIEDWMLLWVMIWPIALCYLTYLALRKKER